MLSAGMRHVMDGDLLLPSRAASCIAYLFSVASAISMFFWMVLQAAVVVAAKDQSTVFPRIDDARQWGPDLARR